MYWIPQETMEVWAAIHGYTTTSGSPPPSSQDAAWEAWQSIMHQYQENSNTGGLPKVNFWLAVSLPKENFSEKLTFHEDVPMLMPASGAGQLLGIALTKDELDAMLQKDSQNVHLTYKVKIQGQKAWRDLLEFMAKHDMLEKE